ncbi:MAG: hypothetical protein MHPSP_000682 [Paramarteilia canceri]
MWHKVIIEDDSKLKIENTDLKLEILNSKKDSEIVLEENKTDFLHDTNDDQDGKEYLLILNATDYDKLDDIETDKDNVDK